MQLNWSARPRAACRDTVLLVLLGLLLVGTVAEAAPHWTGVHREGCIREGVRRYTGHLADTSDWEGDCHRTAGPGVPGTSLGRPPTQCEKNIFTGMWGHWDVADDSCKAHWDRPKKDACLANGNRQWSAILRNIPAGKDATRACHETTISIGGGAARHAVKCTQMIDGMWGEFQVYDKSCKPYWDTPKVEECASPGERHVSAILRNIPGGRDWDDACKRTPLVYKSVTYPIEDAAKDCRRDLFNQMWGNWRVPDPTCAAHWLPPKVDACLAPGLRQISAKLASGTADPLADCNSTSVTYAGKDRGTPLRCTDTGLTGIWGEWAIEDKSCPKPRWDRPKKDYCVAKGKRQYSSILRDIPGSLNWEVACRITPETINGQQFDRPTRCSNEGLGGMWGEFDVNDASCTHDERSDGDRKRDAELEQIDRAIAQSKNIYDRVDGYDLRHIPAGTVGNMLRDVLNSDAVRGGGYDVAAYLVGGGAAVVAGYEHAEGYAMVREKSGGFTCYNVYTNSVTGGIAVGVAGTNTLELVNGGIDAFAGESNGFQGTATYGAGVAVGVHWTVTNNPVNPLYNVLDFGVATSGVDVGFEYVHSYAGLKGKIDCSSLP